MPSLVENYLNRKLNELPGYTGYVSDVDNHLLRGTNAINQLVLKKRGDTRPYSLIKRL